MGNKFWVIFAHEYTRHVLRRRFLVALMALPLWLIFSLVMGLVSVLLVTDHTPVGYVDRAGLITRQSLPPGQFDLITRVSFVPYPDEVHARAALDAKKIQAYFILPPDYAQSLDMRLVFKNQVPSSAVYNQISELLRLNLLTSQPEPIARRLIEGATLVQPARPAAQNSGYGWVKTALPLVAAAFLMIAVFTSSGYLMQAVVEEKENRTMELLATSASPGQIMGGKISALVCVGLTQILAWSIIPAVGVYYVATRTTILSGMDFRPLLLVLITALPTFLIVAALMAAIGATITESGEGQQIASLVTTPVMAPMFLSGLIATSPNGPLAVALSFFPLTASITLLVRAGFASVPAWQIALTTLILILSAAGSVWLAGRIFRAGMLRFGKRMGWRDVFRALRRPARGEAGAHE